MRWLVYKPLISNETSMPSLRSALLSAVLLPFVAGAAIAQDADRRSFPIQVEFPPLMLPDAPRGGAHPVGGPAHVFIEMMNDNGAALGLDVVYHTTGDVPSTDTDVAQPPPLNSQDAKAGGCRPKGRPATRSSPNG